MELLVMGPPYHHPSVYFCHGTPAVGSSRWVVRLQNGAYVASIPAPTPGEPAPPEPPLIQEEALAPPEVPANQQPDGAYDTGHHSPDDWGEVTYGDVPPRIMD